jgi:uncharacterized protein (TIGR02270 family)
MTRYQGNPPRTTSGIVSSDIVEMHAGDAAFLWSTRRKAVKSQKYKLRDLARADERVEAHLEGLEVSRTEGWAKLIADLEDGQPGAVFAGAVWAMRAGDAGRFGAVLDSAGAKPSCLEALVSAFGWAWSGGTADDNPELASGLVGSPSPAADVSGRGRSASAVPPETWARRLLAEPSAANRLVGTGAFAACRVSPTDAEIDVLLHQEPDPSTQARAARLVGELGLAHAGEMLEPLLEHEAHEVREAAAWSLCAFHSNHRVATRVLMTAARNSAPSPDGLAMAARRLAAGHARGWTHELVQEGRGRATLIAAAASGWPAMIDDILALMSRKELARLAGFAFSQITGADLVKLNLEYDDKKDRKEKKDHDDQPPAPEAVADAEDAAPSEDEEEDAHLPDPDPELVAGWWRDHRDELNPTVRYLAGRPIREPGLRQTLIDGTQPQRRAAAVELSCLMRGTPVYNTSQPGFVQARDLLGWT